MTTRRHFVRGLGIGSALAAAGPVRWAFAHAATEKRLVVVVLRGALDGLAAVPPYADRDYAQARGSLALPAPGTADGPIDLDGRFALHPALAPLQPLYQARELLVVHAVAGPYRARSHFDGQDVIENGTDRPRGAGDGWLNRALGVMGGAERRLGLAVGQTVPAILSGAVPVAAWAPRRMPELGEDFLGRLEALYALDRTLGPAFVEGRKAQAMSDDVLGPEEMGGTGKGGGRGPVTLRIAAAAVGKLLAAGDGPRIAVLEMGGWDTHANQGTLGGRLTPVLAALGQGLVGLQEAMGPAAWRQTVVLTMTEFGRTVAVNGTGGTDHGTASVALLLGGAINGARVLADWPGLGVGKLFEGRDLAPTTDLRAIAKAILRDHLGLPAPDIERTVFPASPAIRPLEGLIRRA